MEAILKSIFDAVIEGNASVVQQKVNEALNQGLDAGAVLNQGMIVAMAEVGKRFEEGEFFVPEMLIAARAMQSGLAILKPHLQLADVKTAGKSSDRHGEGRFT